jgi:CRISPR type I-D-associated protein Csc2
MRKYQVVVLRSLKGFGQFVTESRDEVNTYEFGEEDERPVIFGDKLKAVERRTTMRKVREVLGVNCWLTTHKKGGDSGISGLCMSCPACVLFGGTYAPKKGGGGGGSKNVIEMRRVFYTAAFPFNGGGIRDVTFNAVDERTGQTGQALGTNQIIEPRDFIDVVTVEADDEAWVKFVIWGIEHSDRYGANTRIYGEIHNEVLGVLADTRLHLAAIDLARLKDAGSVKKHVVEERKLSLKVIGCADSEIAPLIQGLAKLPEVEDLSRRKNRVDLSVPEYFEIVAQKWDKTLLEKEIKEDNKKAIKWDKWTTDQRISELHAEQLGSEARKAITQNLKLLPPEKAPEGWQAKDEDRLNFLKTQFGLARVIESAICPVEAEEEEEEVAPK